MKESPSKLCFVIGPIGDEDSEDRIHADWLLEEVILPVMKDFPQYYVRRPDQDHRPGLIDAQLINDLLDAELVIADLSRQNPNAFYEIGIRHMRRKPIIHMQLAGENIPFDLSLYRAIKFSRARPKDLRVARDLLKSYVKAVHSEGFQVENPVTRARGIIKVDEHATPEQQLLTDFASRLTNLESVLRQGGSEVTPFITSSGKLVGTDPLVEKIRYTLTYPKIGKTVQILTQLDTASRVIKRTVPFATVEKVGTDLVIFIPRDDATAFEEMLTTNPSLKQMLRDAKLARLNTD
jgi:hypothetical protein